jgi:DHA3 family macrolide efflux protein-like MFS transporter
VPTTTLLQETVDPGMQGRVFSVMQMINTTVMPLGMLVFGPLADVVAIELLLVLTGLFIVLPSIWLYRVKPFGRKIDPNPIQAD